MIELLDGTEQVRKVCEQSTLEEMQEKTPKFFEMPFGENEQFIVYRGQLIVQCTVQFTGCLPERKTVVYLFFPEENDLFCCAGVEPKNRREAESLIDYIFMVKRFGYGIGKQICNDCYDDNMLKIMTAYFKQSKEIQDHIKKMVDVANNDEDEDTRYLAINTLAGLLDYPLGKD